MNFEKKYNKYKTKYLNLKGGHCPSEISGGQAHYFGEDERVLEECKICYKIKNNNIKLLPCCHKLCKTCFINYVGMENRNCPTCKLVFHDYFELVWITTEKLPKVKSMAPEVDRRRTQIMQPSDYLINLPEKIFSDVKVQELYNSVRTIEFKNNFEYNKEKNVHILREILSDEKSSSVLAEWLEPDRITELRKATSDSNLLFILYRSVYG